MGNPAGQCTAVSRRGLGKESEARDIRRGGREQQSTKLRADVRIDEFEDMRSRDASMRRLPQATPRVRSRRLGALGQMPVAGGGANLSSEAIFERVVDGVAVASPLDQSHREPPGIEYDKGTATLTSHGAKELPACVNDLGRLNRPAPRAHDLEASRAVAIADLDSNGREARTRAIL